MFQGRTPSGADFQIVFQTDCLGIQFKDVIRVPVENLKEMIDQVHEPHPELLERLIPFAVPVRMGDYMKMKAGFTHIAYYFAFGKGDAMIFAAGIQMSLYEQES